MDRISRRLERAEEQDRERARREIERIIGELDPDHILRVMDRRGHPHECHPELTYQLLHAATGFPGDPPAKAAAVPPGYEAAFVAAMRPFTTRLNELRKQRRERREA
jgi:hypothetical protein